MSDPPFETLFELSRRYASAADRRHSGDFVSVFVPDGQLRICAVGDPGRIVRTRHGHDELAAIPEALARYDRTFHLLGQAGFERHGERATGEVHCIAHHLTVGEEGAEDKVMYIRYADDYCVDPAGAWRIAHRRVQIDWTETRPTELAP